MKTPVLGSRTEIPHHFSRRLLIFYTMAWLGVLLAFAVVNVNLTIRGLVLVFFGLGAWQIGSQLYLLRNLRTILIYDGRVSLRYDNRVIPVKVNGGALVNEYLIAFHCEPLDKTDLKYTPRYILLLRDSISAEDHHYLRLTMAGC